MFFEIARIKMITTYYLFLADSRGHRVDKWYVSGCVELEYLLSYNTHSYLIYYHSDITDTLYFPCAINYPGSSMYLVVGIGLLLMRGFLTP